MIETTVKKIFERPVLAIPEALQSAMVIDLSATAHNYRVLQKQAGKSHVACVLKADGYGVGAVPVALTNYQEGCRNFFVALADEGVQLRNAFKEKGLTDAHIFVLNGFFPGSEDFFEEYGLIPVLTDLEQIARRQAQAHRLGKKLPGALHIDTGMVRTGLPVSEVYKLAEQPHLLEGIDVVLVMSHMVYSHDEKMSYTYQQQIAFDQLRAHLPEAPASLAKSGVVFLGDEFQYEMVRPGIALHGINPTNKANPLQPVVSVYARLIHVQQTSSGVLRVGRSATPSKERRIATLAIGNLHDYWHHATVLIAGHSAPVVDRLSLNFLTVDVTHLPENQLKLGEWVQLAGTETPIDHIARDAKTTPYEVLIRLGNKLPRIYGKES